MTTYLGTSQNGWAVYDDTEHFTRTRVADIGFWSASADVAVVLDYFTQWFHDNIESLNLKVTESPGYDDWSYAVRPVRGQTSGYSNHASATARDLNSSRHPRGVKGTFTGDQRARLRAFVNSEIFLIGGLSVIRSGEFYSSTIDGMHIEINAGRTAVGLVADRIRAQKEGKLIVDKTDEAKIRAIFAAEIRDWATKEKFIPNVAPGQVAATSKFTLEGALQLNDQKLDRGNDKDNTMITVVTDIQHRLDAQNQRMNALESTLAAILAAVTPTKGA